MLGKRSLDAAAKRRLPAGLHLGFGARAARKSAQPMDQIRSQLALPARMPPWVAGIFATLLVASGTVPIIRALSPSYAGIPTDRAPSAQRADPRRSGDIHGKDGLPEVAAAGTVTARRSGMRCAECGVIVSMRRLVRSDDAGATLGGSASGGTAGQPMPADGANMPGYEFTVRFRDGSVLVFNEATPRTWRPGSRVIVIGRGPASTELP